MARWREGDMQLGDLPIGDFAITISYCRLAIPNPHFQEPRAGKQATVSSG
jgi:hypothetical protein